MVIALLLLLGGVEANPGPSVNQLCSIGCLNIRSVIHKSALLHTLIKENNLDVIALCETWTSADDPPAILHDAAPSGFQVSHVPRSSSVPGKRGGGLAVIHKNTVVLRTMQLSTAVSTFELQSVVLRFARSGCLLLNVYRPPHQAPSQRFFNELADVLMEASTEYPGAIILCGDVNCAGVTRQTIDENLQLVLNNADFDQHVSTPTRESSILDIMASSRFNSPIKSVKVIDSHLISDHWLVKAVVDFNIAPTAAVQRNWRQLRNIDYNALDHTLMCSTLVTDISVDVDSYADDIVSVVLRELDKLAPVKTTSKSNRVLPCDAFLSAEARHSIHVRRRLERVWLRKGNDTVRKEYRQACREANKCINDSRAKYLSTKIDAASNARQKWREYCRLLHPNTAVVKGPGENSGSLCSKLSEYFITKITNLHDAAVNFLVNAGLTLDPFLFDKPVSGQTLSCFSPVTPQEVLKLISTTAIKFSPLNAFPSVLIKLSQ